MRFKILILRVLTPVLLFSSCKRDIPRVLVFSKTSGYRHGSIEAGKLALLAMGARYHFEVDITENDSAFYEENLLQYKAVLFLNTTGDVLTVEQQNHLERFMQAGGGFVGIHSATDTEYGWPWYGKMVGAYFKDHPGNPNVQAGELYVVDKHHPACDSLPDRFRHTDEFYNFKQVNKDIKPLINIDEKSYREGKMGDHHPISWYHEYDGGRVFYTAMGHTIESFSEPLFLNHLWGGLKYVLDDGNPLPLNYNAIRTPKMPEENRFTKVVLAEGLNEPLELAILPDGNVLFIERYGAVKIYDQAKKETRVVDTIAVRHGYTDVKGKEILTDEGLLGLQVDPNFDKNNFIYFYYSPVGNSSTNTLVRYEFKDGKLVRESPKVILEVPVERGLGWLTGGSIAFDGQGNLFLSVGSDTDFGDEGEYSPADERPGRGRYDAQRTAGNTNDLRGHILRIHPEPDGSYSIPEGNLFPKGMAKTRPEIYAMGNRNPHRISVDRKTGYLYWGNVGPDAAKDSVPLGPMGYDELNQAKKAGNFGWPYFTGNNRPFVDYDFATKKSGAKYDPARPVNHSPNNTGLTELPPVSPPFIWYAHSESEEFPMVGSGGQIAMPGPVFNSDEFIKANRPFPDYYDGKLFFYDGVRGWIMTVTMDKEGNYESMEPFMGSHKFDMPMDMAFDQDGDLYLLEYGLGQSAGRLLRIEYTSGNRNPVAKVSADKMRGAVPFTAHFNSRATVDYDRDKLSYKWNILSPEGKSLQTFTSPDIHFDFNLPGKYEVELTVMDGKGGLSVSKAEVLAGNEPPRIELAITRGNSSLFFPGQYFDYKVSVFDEEDGSTESGSIDPDSVRVTVEYLPEGFDKELLTQGNSPGVPDPNGVSVYSAGKNFLDKSDCKVCHALDKKSLGPSFMDVSNKYKSDPKALSYLAKKIKEGGGGVWGEVMMVPHPSLPDKEITDMVRYIMSLAQKPAPLLPLKGSYTTLVPKGQSDQGAFLLRASYTDKGSSAGNVPGIGSEQMMLLRNAGINASLCDAFKDIERYKQSEPALDMMIVLKSGAYLAFKGVDLKGIESVALIAVAPSNHGFIGGLVEVRLGSPLGELIGASPPIVPGPVDFLKPFNPITVVAPLKSQEGKHDVYFVCKNDQPGIQPILFALMQVQFQRGQGKRLN